MEKDKDLEKILEFLIKYNHGNFEKIFRFVGHIGRNTLYKKLNFLIKEGIIQKSPKNIYEGKDYLLGNKIEFVHLETLRLFGKEYAKQWLKIKKLLIKIAVIRGFLSKQKASS